MYAMTAAHTQLPLPTYVQVTNLKNGKQVILRVNDRGPFHGNRIIDLSYSAAMKLDIVREGTGLVEVRALDPRHYGITKNKSSNQTLSQASGKTKEVNSNQDVNINSEPVVFSSEVLESQAEPVETNSDSSVVDATTVTASGPQVFVQVGAFGEHKNADQLKNQLNGLNLGAVTISSVVKNSKPLHRVRIGPLDNVQSADDTVAQLSAMGMNDHRIVIE